jgi:hypothetical protein
MGMSRKNYYLISECRGSAGAETQWADSLE